jgi:hypothetical protein
MLVVNMAGMLTVRAECGGLGAELGLVHLGSKYCMALHRMRRLSVQ